jgi:hypothetical protein
LGVKADIDQTLGNVRFWHKADIAKNSDFDLDQFKVVTHDLSSMTDRPSAKQAPSSHLRAELLPPLSPGSAAAASRAGSLHAGIQGSS